MAGAREKVWVTRRVTMSTRKEVGATQGSNNENCEKTDLKRYAEEPRRRKEDDGRRAVQGDEIAGWTDGRIIGSVDVRRRGQDDPNGGHL